MAGAEGVAEDTDLTHENSIFGLDNSSLTRDHCDLLLDAIDAQLDQLQVQPQKKQIVTRQHDCSVASCFRWNNSVSKDTGLGSTNQTKDSPMSCLDLLHIPIGKLSSERSPSVQKGPVVNEKTEVRSKRETIDQEEMESKTEQAIWRLERLLGDTCREEELAGEIQPLSDSICTEDFFRCFREEMVEPALSESNMLQIDPEENAEGTEIFDSDTCQSKQKRQNGCHFERTGSTLPEKGSKTQMIAHYSKPHIYVPHQKIEPETFLSVRYVTSHFSEKTEARQRNKQLQHTDDNNSGHRCTSKNVQNTNIYVNKAQHSKKETSRPRCSFGENDKNKEEKNNFWNRGCTTDWELEWLPADTAQMEEEKNLECVLIDSREESGSISCELKNLQKKRGLEVGHTENKLKTLCHHKQTQTAESSLKKNTVLISVLEKEEMERQLDNAKIELFAEQRRARKELELMQEKLEVTCELLQTATEAEISLRNECACSEDNVKKEQIEALETRVRELQVELGECKVRLHCLEKLLAQKDQQLIDQCEQSGALQAERDGLKVELQHLKTTYCKALKEAHEEAYRIKVNQETREGEVSALKEKTSSLTQCIKSMQSSIQVKEEKATQLRKSMEQQREQSKNHEKQLHVEALEKVQKAIDEERRKWAAEKVAMQMHCRILEEQNRKSLENMRSEIQQERSKELAIQQKVSKLETKVQELESERCAQQREHESLLAGIKSLKEDHQAELHRLQKLMAQESQSKVLHLEQAVQLAEKEAGRFRVKLEERESSHIQITAELDQQLRTWAQDLGTECQHLYHLVEQCGAKQNALHLPLSPSLAEALTNLRLLRDLLKHVISHLHQELDLQKQTSQQLKEDKERELSIQRQQLRVERDQALGFLKVRLIQEHTEELSKLNLLRFGGEVADKKEAEYLQKQLKAKDLELRQTQKNMGQLKDQAAAHLVELERKASDKTQEKQKMNEGTEEKMSFSAKEPQTSFSSFYAMDSAASYSSSDMASFKLLSYLQNRVKQLRVENQAYTCNQTPPDSHPSKTT